MDHKIKQNGTQKFVMTSLVLKISSIRNQAKNWEMKMSLSLFINHQSYIFKVLKYA